MTTRISDLSLSQNAIQFLQTNLHQVSILQNQASTGKKLTKPSDSPIDIGQSDVHDHQVDLSVFGGLDAFRAAVHRNGIKFLVQRQLLDERVAQFGVVVDDQDRSFIGHWF